MSPTKTHRSLKSDLNRLDRETEMMLTTADSLSADELAGASAVEGWTLAHVLADLARDADRRTALATWAVTGERPDVPSPSEHRSAVEEGAGRAPVELKADLHEACERFRSAARRLTGDLAAEEVELDGEAISAFELPSRRTTAVVFGHGDLGTVWELDEADPDAVLDALEYTVAGVERGDAVPDATITTEEGETYVLGSGAEQVGGSRQAVALWLARGDRSGLRTGEDAVVVTAG